jgi:integrase
MPSYRIAKRPDSPRWYVCWTEGRRSYRVPTGTESREEAQQFLTAFCLERDRPANAQPEDLGIAQVLTWYYDEHASKLPSAEQADIAISHLNKFYGASRLDAINGVSHAKYEAQRRAKGIGWQTINRERMVLRAALNHAHRHHGLVIAPHVPTIPASHPENAPVEPKGRPLSVAELRALYHASEGHMRRLVLILVGTLCRPDAAKDLQPDKQCDFTHGLIDLNPQGRKQTKKHRPVIPMVGFLRKELRKARGHAIQFRGEKIGSTKTAWRALRDKAGLDARVTPYSIRHTVARWLRANKVPGDQVSVMLGHRPAGSSRTDLVYAPFEPGYCKDAVRALVSLHRLIHRKARQTRAKTNVDKNRPVKKKPVKPR